MTPQETKIQTIYKHYMSRVPSNLKLDLDDLGFIILKSICESNGSTLVDKEIFLDGQVIGNQVNYRFNGTILELAYWSIPYKKIIQKTIRV